MTASRQRGFTLIELVVTLVIAGVVVGFMALFMVTPVDAYFATARRAELNDSANSAMRVLSQDIRNALPESVRYGSAGALVAVEVLVTREAIRYRRAGLPSSTPNTQVDFGIPESNFNVVGAFASMPAAGVMPYQLVIGYTGGNYPTVGTITPVGTTVTIARPPGGEDTVTLSAPVTFPPPGAVDNLFVLEGPVTYICNITPGVNTLTRYSNYTFTPTLVVGVPPGATSNVVARDVTACSVNYVQGTAQRGGLVMLQLTVSRNGETLNVMHQVQVENRP